MVGTRVKWSIGVGVAVAGVALIFLRRYFSQFCSSLLFEIGILLVGSVTLVQCLQARQ